MLITFTATMADREVTNNLLYLFSIRYLLVHFEMLDWVHTHSTLGRALAYKGGREDGVRVQYQDLHQEAHSRVSISV